MSIKKLGDPGYGSISKSKVSEYRTSRGNLPSSIYQNNSQLVIPDEPDYIFESLSSEYIYPGPNITVGPTPPENPSVGDLWVDTN